MTVGFGEHYESSYEEAIFSRLQDLGVSQMFQDLKVLFYSDHRSGSFRINFGGHWETVNAVGLQKKFYDADPTVLGATGNVKPINKSVNDLFQVWSRSYLNPYCVVNDVDALVRGEKSNKIIELKRRQAVHPKAAFSQYLDLDEVSGERRIRRTSLDRDASSVHPFTFQILSIALLLDADSRNNESLRVRIIELSKYLAFGPELSV